MENEVDTLRDERNSYWALDSIPHRQIDDRAVPTGQRRSATTGGGGRRLVPRGASPPPHR